MKKLTTIQHLYTPVKATLLDGEDVWTAALALWPNPAIGGEPREKAVRWIRKFEKLNRGWYSGVVGLMNAQPGRGGPGRRHQVGGDQGEAGRHLRRRGTRGRLGAARGVRGDGLEAQDDGQGAGRRRLTPGGVVTMTDGGLRGVRPVVRRRPDRRGRQERRDLPGLEVDAHRYSVREEGRRHPAVDPLRREVSRVLRPRDGEELLGARGRRLHLRDGGRKPPPGGRRGEARRASRSSR